MLAIVDDEAAYLLEFVDRSRSGKRNSATSEKNLIGNYSWVYKND